MKMLQRTIVALYGPKPARLAKLIKSVQGRLSCRPGLAFVPYPLCQVHATLIGLEEDPAGSGQHRNFKLPRQSRQMDLAGYRHYLRDCFEWPLYIQIGGFEGGDASFSSRGQAPYHRTFSLVGDKAVLMGWPVQGKAPGETGVYPPTLDQLRRAGQRFGISHAYHQTPSDIDNDFYMRLGLLGQVDATKRQDEDLQREIRAFMSSLPPLILKLELSDLSVVSYQAATLPWGQSKVEPV